MNSVIELVKLYNKEEVLQLVQELDLGLDESLPSMKLVELMVADLTEFGLPEEEMTSELMEDFLIDAGFVDEDGNVLERQVAKTEEKPQSAPTITIPVEGIDVNKVPCFGFADVRAPECNRCKLFDPCTSRRLAVRATMACFGKMFDIDSEECRGCLEAGPCRIECQK